MRISISAPSGMLLSSLKTRRVVLLPNHPDRQDALVACELGKQLGGNVFAVAARELFEWNNGWRGWLYQRFGCYSVTRGKVDFESISTTKKVLSQSRAKLLAFPEAEITCDDELVHEFQPGFLHLLLKQNLETQNIADDDGLCILPVSIRYEVDRDFEVQVKKCITRLCRHLHIAADESDLEQALNQLVDKHLAAIAQIHNVPIDTLQPQWQRAYKIIEQLVERYANYLHVRLEFAPNTDEARYQLRNTLNDRLKAGVLKGTSGKIGEDAVRLYTDISYVFDALERWTILAKALQKSRSPARIIQILDYIEADTIGQMTPKCWQTAVVLLGEPISLNLFMDDYKLDAAGTVERLTNRVEHDIQQLLVTSVSLPHVVAEAA